MMQFTPYALPAMVALVAKAGIFFYARRSNVRNLQTRVYLLFLSSIFIQNVAELTFFTAKAAHLPEPSGGRLYFVASIPAIAFLLDLALATATKWRNKPGPTPALGVALVYAPAVLLEVLLLSTPLVVAGFAPLSYTYTKVPGPLYFLFELYAVGYLLAATLILAYGIRSHNLPFKRLQNKFTMIGLTPWIGLVIVIIVLQRFEFRVFNSTATLPLAITFFLVVSAYATHQYRLFDIEFYIPWSKVRKRKTVFYQRIQATIAAIAELQSVRAMIQMIADTLRCQVALVGGTQPIAALVAGQENDDRSLLSRFPRAALDQVEQIVVAVEIADTDPALHRLMQQYNVGAIVPFKLHNTVARRWLVLGDHFSNEVYTPLDFKVVEGLFAAMAERFLDDFLEVRSQLHETQEDLRQARQHLGLIWHEEDQAKKQLEKIEAENRKLLLERERLRRKAEESTDSEALEALPPEVGFDEYIKACEREALLSAIDRSGGNKADAAQILGISLLELERLAALHGIDQSRWMVR